MTLWFRKEISNLNYKLFDTEQKKMYLDGDLEWLRDFTCGVGTSLDNSQNALQGVSKDLAQFGNELWLLKENAGRIGKEWNVKNYALN